MQIIEPQANPSIAESVEQAFDTIEWAVKGASNRGRFERVEDFRPAKHAVDAYCSVLHFTPDVQEYATDRDRNRRYRESGRPSVASYDGPAKADGLHFELDAKDDLPRAQRELEMILAALEEVGIPREAVELAFSGSKGFHGFIPAALFGGFEPAPCRGLAARLKALAHLLLDNLELTTVDWGVYDATRLWRCENTKHSGSERYCIPVTADEASGPLDALLALAAGPRVIDRPDRDEWLARPELAELWARAASAAVQRHSGSGAHGPIPEKIVEPNRHDTLRRVAVRLAHQGHSEGQIRALLLVMNAEQCDPPKPEEEVCALAAWAGDAVNHDDNEDGDGWDTARDAERAKRLEEEGDAARDRERATRERLRAIEHRQSRILAVIANDKAQRLKLPAIALGAYLDDPLDKLTTNADGFVRVTIRGQPRDLPKGHPDRGKPTAGSLASYMGVGGSSCSRYLHEFERAGLLSIQYESPHPVCGEPWKTICWLKLKDSADEFLRKVACLSSEKRQGGERPRCPRCGSEAQIRVTYCAACGEVLVRQLDSLGDCDSVQNNLGEEAPTVDRAITVEQERIRQNPVRQVDTQRSIDPVRQLDALGDGDIDLNNSYAVQQEILATADAEGRRWHPPNQGNGAGSLCWYCHGNGQAVPAVALNPPDRPACAKHRV